MLILPTKQLRVGFNLNTYRSTSIMNIVLTSPENCTTLSSFLHTNQIPYQFLDLWDSKNKKFDLPLHLIGLSKSLVVLSPRLLMDLLSSTETKSQLLLFSKHNNLWIWADIDGLVSALRYVKELKHLDIEIPRNHISWFIDGKMTDDCELKNLRNIHFKEIPYNWFLGHMRVPLSMTVKNNAAKDFMITTVKKHNRPHRDILWQNLIRLPGLLQRGHCKYGSNEEWIGQKPPLEIKWKSGYLSLDLYQSSWLELVPETLCDNGHFITEKTVKPMVAKTPFLIMSTCGYLAYLRSFGFKTFDSVIDESYDKEPNLDRRASMIVDQLAQITAKGAENFYYKCRDIVEHNHKVLMEISGKKHYVIDQFLSANLAQIDMP